MGQFGRVLTAMITPFTPDGAVDFDGAARLARWLTENGSEGLVVAGTTGESPTLTHDEQAELVETVVDAVGVPVVAGAGSNDTRAAIDLTQRCAQAGAAGLLHVAGYYNRPSQAGLEAHFRHCAEATDLPIIIYDIPVRTGRKIATQTLVRLVREVPNIVGVKDAAGSVAETARLLELAPECEVYAGDDSLMLPLLAVGATGVIGVATHWAGVETAAMFDAFEAGRVAEAAAINRRLLDSYDFETGDDAPNPVPTKAMLRVMGLPSGPCRLPMGPEPADLEARAREVLATLRGASEPEQDSSADASDNASAGASQVAATSQDHAEPDADAGVDAESSAAETESDSGADSSIATAAV